MRGEVIIYQLDTKKLAKKDIVKFHRELYGYTDYSQYGRYKYCRKGLIDEVKAWNPCSSVIVSKKEDSKRIINLIRKFTKKIFVRDVILTEKDMKKIRCGDAC